ncbi:hypothetical protein [Candidatus Electronema sp. PJ]|uniref:hypothetical protein n=1 Tax=Candidatus Electronema sp. PJ TaxID=3401572 RepID=UPI003AA7B855
MKTTRRAVWAGVVACCALQAGSALASVDQLDMLKTAKHVEIFSQKIAKAYFYKQLDIRPDQAEADLKESLSKLKSSIATLQEGSDGNSKEERNIGKFLAYTHGELDSMLSKPYNKEAGALMIDFSESLLEGANNLAGKYKGKGAEATMLTETEQLLFLLERVNKYYIAHKAGFKDYNNVVQLEKAVKDFETGLAKINAYSYPENVQANVKNINQFWPVAKEFYLGVQENALPVIVLASTDKLESEVKALETFHTQEAVKK